jgi:MEMO1 family protein
MQRILVMFLLLMTLQLLSVAQSRRPVRDDVGFCWEYGQMQRLVSSLDSIERDPVFDGTIIAGVSPHDDFLYASRVYYPLHRVIRAKEAVIFGVTHGTVRKEIGDPRNIVMLDSFPVWTGLKTDLRISPLREELRAKLPPEFFRTDNRAHTLEHSIEALVPFLQYYNPDIRITPIMVTAMPFGRMDTVSDTLSAILTGYIRRNGLTPGKDIVILCSSDANHYGADFSNTPFGESGAEAHRMGTEQDVRVATECLTGDLEPAKIRTLTERLASILWCGKYSVPMGLLTAQKTVESVLHRKLTGTLLRYSDTMSEGVIPLKGTSMGTTAPFSFRHWVGFCSIGYTLK